MASWTTSLIVLTFHVFIPFGVIAYFHWRRRLRRSRLLWVATSLFVGSGLLYFLFHGRNWAWVSYYLPYLQLILFALAVAAGLTKLRDKPWLPKSGFGEWTTTIAALVMAGLFSSVLPGYWEAQQFEADPIQLAFPLESGDYFIGHGGTSNVLNQHYREATASRNAQRFALDIIATNILGTRAKGLYPRDLDAYEIYKKRIMAPCSGPVVGLREDMLDRRPPKRNREHILGNYVAVYCQGATVVLAHLNVGSVIPKSGESIESGQPLAKVGNTGDTTEPHLHIHAVRGRVTNTEKLTNSARPVPMVFGPKRRFYVRNQIVSE